MDYLLSFALSRLFHVAVEKALRKVHAILGTEKHVRLASDDFEHKDYQDKYALAEFLTNTSVAAQLTVLEHLGLTQGQLQTLLQWVHDQHETVTLQFQAEDGCSFLKEQEVEVGSTTSTTTTTTSGAVEVINDRPPPVTTAPSSFFGSSSAKQQHQQQTQQTQRVVNKIKEYHWKVYVSYKLVIYKGSSPTREGHFLELQSRHASTILITSGGQAAHAAPRGGKPQQTNKPIPPIVEKTIHPATEVSLTWLLQTLNPTTALMPTNKKEEEKAAPEAVSTNASIASQTTVPTDNKDTSTGNNAPDMEEAVVVVSQFTINRTVPSCRTPRRNQDIQIANEFHQSLVHWMLSVLNFFLDRLEKEILAKHNPAKLTPDSSASPNSNTAARFEVNTKCQMVGLEKEPSFNHKFVVVKEYLSSADRYRVEPLNPSDGLPPSLTIKKANLKRNTSSNSTGSASATTGALGGPRLSRVSVEDVFVPTLPLFLEGKVLALPDANALLQGQTQSIQQAFHQIARVFPPRQVAKLASQAEAQILLLCTHWLDLIEHYQNGMNSIEHMLRQQLVQAIGREVHATDLDAFLKFHLSKKLLAPAYAPKPFTYAVRRPNQYPDGMVTIESTWLPSSPSALATKGNPSIHTMVRHIPGGKHMPSIYMPINATTSIELTGDRYLHGWMQHQFDKDEQATDLDAGHAEYQLVARAQQFSNFLLVIGSMAGPDTLEPKAAIVLQNKDEVIIPLLTQVLPSSQEFKDAVASLSPEQQAFCRAFRGMQLESSVFGICIIQLKPQLEELLGLPPKSLTKEIQLTQDLMSLFVEYQIPSDLLSYDEEEAEMDDEVLQEADGEAPSPRVHHQRNAARKLAAVKAHVKSVVTVIEAEKEKQFVEEERKAEMRSEMKHLADKETSNDGKTESNDITEETDTFDDQVTLTSSLVGQASMSSRSTVRKMTKGPMKQKSKPLMRRRALIETAHSSVTPAAMPASPPMSSAKQMYAMSVTQSSAPVRENANIPTSPTRSPQKSMGTTTTTSTSMSVVEDFTLLPHLLDEKLDKYDTDHALRSTVLTTGSKWTRRRQANLLVPPQSTELNPAAVDQETQKAFDLLDALSRSGTLPIASAELHVIVAVSHCFENDVMGSVIQDNINPIEKVERSALLIGSTIHGQACNALLSDSEQEDRLAKAFPSLFISEF